MSQLVLMLVTCCDPEDAMIPMGTTDTWLRDGSRSQSAIAQRSSCSAWKYKPLNGSRSFFSEKWSPEAPKLSVDMPKHETTFADGMDGMDNPPTKEIIEVYSCGNHLLGENLKIRGLWYSSTTATHKFTFW